VTVGTIAYVTTIDGALPRTIRLVNGDGTEDRELFALPDDANSSAFVSGLAWRRDATELAFYSNFELSIWDWDIYALTATGDNLRRITNVPRPIAYSNYPQGSATLAAKNAEVAGRFIQTYIEGSQQAFSWLAPSLESRAIEFSLADFGPGIQQISRVNNDVTDCWFDFAANVDVVADESISIPQQLPPSSLTRDEICPRAFYPQWGSDDNLYFVRLTRLDAILNGIDNVFSVMRTPTDDLQPQNRGARLFAVGRGTFGQENGFDDIRDLQTFRVSPEAGSDQVLFSESITFQTDKVFLTNLNNPQNMVQLSGVMPDCGALGQPDCSIRDIRWLSDGSGFIYSLVLRPEFSTDDTVIGTQVRQYTVRNGVVEDVLLTESTDTVFGEFSISPDGGQLAIELQGAEVGFTDLYRYDIATDTFSLLTENAGSPAWARTQ